MMHTFRYKQGYIHVSVTDGKESVRVSVKPYALVRLVKSVRAAKQLITRGAK